VVKLALGCLLRGLLRTDEVASRMSVRNITQIPLTIARTRPIFGSPVKFSHITARNHAITLRAMTAIGCNPDIVGRVRWSSRDRRIG
jgi:hypothetical protein